MNSAKLKISTIVQKWERDNPILFEAYSAARKIKTENLANDFAEVGKDGFILRLLYELPEDLDFLVHQGLDDAEQEWLKTAPGGKWFAKNFKQYNVSQKT